MPFQLNNFMSKLQYGGARQNLFEVRMPFPPITGGTSNTELFSFMCKAASLPPEEIGVIPVPYFGRTIKIPGNRTFPDWQVTVINDEDFTLRNTFERWSNAMNGHENNLRNGGAEAFTDYSTDGTVIQYNKTGFSIKEYSMIGMWPSAITQIDLGWDANDQIEDFQVTFQYQWWKSVTTS